MFQNLAIVTQMLNIIYLKLITQICSTDWIDSPKTSMKKLKIAYNNKLRFLGIHQFNSASQMFVNLNIPPFGELIKE